MAVTAARRSASSSPSTAGDQLDAGRARARTAVAHSCATSATAGNAREVGQLLRGPRPAARASTWRAGRGAGAGRPGRSVGSASTTRSTTPAGSTPRAPRPARAGVRRGDDHPAAVVHQRRDGGGDLGGLDVVQDHQRVVADRRDHASRARRPGAAAAGAARPRRPASGSRRGGAGPAAGHPRTTARRICSCARAAARSDPGRTEPVDDGHEALVVARARPDFQHSVTSARSDATEATVTVRIAGLDTKCCSPARRILNGRRREATPCDVRIAQSIHIPHF